MSVATLTINPALDKSTSVQEVISADKMRCTSPVFEAGGGGINVSRVIHRLGGRSKAIFQSSGPSGNYIQQALQKEGLDVEVFTTKEWTRENFIVTEESTQKQFRFGMPGPSLTEAELQDCITLVKEHASSHEFLVLSGSLPPNVPTGFYVTLCTWAKAKGIKTILDTKGPALKAALAEGVYLVKPNLKELGELVGEVGITEERAHEIAKEIIEKKQAQLVVVSLGEKGAMMVSSEGVAILKSPKIEVKSAVGAGDSMVAGLVYALQERKSNLEVLKYGVACGTAAAITAGTELCKKQDVLTVLEHL